ncbi:DAZ-associated protein 2-like isoform X1 [Mus caroli]|uniref:DAZ-associated protein 2 n=1 Tax=Mus caroli TaxID=10089 RepID=A0A6P5P7X1_MUSCR|nr:DAZ-associated protein 2-like isoform X1 [Mus caroli]
MNSNSQYPTQPTYPVQSPGNPVSPKFLHLPQAPPYTDALPAYQSSFVAVEPLGSTIHMAYYPVGPVYPPRSAVLVAGGYDAGARFGAGAPDGSIPPPPPGCPLNTAQLAIMQRAKVLVTQRKGNFFTDVSDGGYFIW